MKILLKLIYWYVQKGIYIENLLWHVKNIMHLTERVFTCSNAVGKWRQPQKRLNNIFKKFTIKKYIQ